MTAQMLAERRVLVLEDRFLIALEICDRLQELGATLVGPFAEIESALGALEDAKVDLGLLDVNLNGTPVFPVAERLAALGVPFIFMTGYDEATMPREWRDRPRLAKPVDPRQLEAELARFA